MTRRPLRMALLLAGALIAGGAIYEIVTGARAESAAEAAARGFESQARTAELAVADLRGAQQGYVAAGQGEAYWIEKVDAALPALRDAMAALRQAATAPATPAALDDASAALEDFVQVDRRARELARGAQRLLASDLIFSDGLELTRAVAGHLHQARMAEAQARQAATIAMRQRSQYVAGGALGAGVLVALLLFPSGRRTEPAPVTARPSARAAPRAPAGQRDAIGAALDAALSDWDKPRVATAPRPDIDLAAAAALCTDLARVARPSDLPDLLARAAAVLDAQGIVLWLADPSGGSLNPALAHGYAPAVVGRLGTLSRDADNATAAAFRTGEPRVVKAHDEGGAGALAIPLLTPAGCVGVMAAELRGQGEQRAQVKAVATIVAAQVAALVGAAVAPAAAEQPAPPDTRTATGTS
jgi:CHASE3 domain sensor protein